MKHLHSVDATFDEEREMVVLTVTCEECRTTHLVEVPAGAAGLIAQILQVLVRKWGLDQGQMIGPTPPGTSLN